MIDKGVGGEIAEEGVSQTFLRAELVVDRHARDAGARGYRVDGEAFAAVGNKQITSSGQHATLGRFSRSFAPDSRIRTWTHRISILQLYV